MAKRAGGVLLPDLVSADREAPLRAQIYGRIRNAILAGIMPPGSRLPSTRTLAGDLGVSRNTAEDAFGQLEAEGYLVRRVGDGSYVARLDPDRPLRARTNPVHTAPALELSSRGRLMARAPACDEPGEPRAFDAGFPALDAFPLSTWHRLLVRRSRRSGRRLLGYGDPAGYPPLREAVATYLGTSRGVACRPEQVLILTSSQQALDLVARVLLDPGDLAWLEDPGYLGARAALTAAGARIVPVAVDSSGLDVEAGRVAAPRARVAYVTPSHQYPTGITMSLDRRLALLGWAERSGAWIIEDDYDSEFRHDGRPIAAIQGLAASGRVLYVGTFTKVLFPSVRVAYLVAPPHVIEPLVTARTLLDGHTSQLTQAVLADFMKEGHFGAHVRKMRALYRDRRDTLVRTAERELAGRLRLGPSDAGLQLAAYLTRDRDDRKIARRAATEGLDVLPLSRYSLAPRPEPGLILGYAALTPSAIREGVRRLSRVL